MCHEASSRPKRSTHNENPNYGTPKRLDITSKRYDEHGDKVEHLKEIAQDSTNHEMGIPTLALDWKPEDDNNYSKAMTDYNNPAKTG